MENRHPHRRAAAIFALALVPFVLVPACGQHDAESAWGTALRLEGSRNDVLFEVAEETGVPVQVLMVLAFQQSRFEEPELVLDENDMEGAAEVPEDLIDAEIPMDEERLAEEPDFTLEDDLTVPGYEDEGEAALRSPETDAYVLESETPAGDAAEILPPEGIDPTSEEIDVSEGGDLHPELDAAGIFYLTSEQVTWAAHDLGIEEDDVRVDLLSNVRAAAALLLGDLRIDGTPAREASHRRWEEAMVRFVGMDPSDEAGTFVRAELHALLVAGLTHTTADGEQLFLGPAGDRTAALEAAAAPLEEGVATADVRGSYPSIEWISASSSNYSSGRGGNRVRYVVIHDIEGTMPGAIAVFRNPAYSASAHYIVRSRDGHIVQMVRESDTAWHAGHWVFNSAGIGIEHEGFAHRPQGGGYYTDRLYRSSAELTCAIARRYDIPVDRRHIIGHANVPRSRSSTTLCPDSRPCGGVSGHTDPGRYWNWRLYMNLVSQCVRGRDLPSGDPPRPSTPSTRRAISTGWGGQRAVLDADGVLHVLAVDARHRLVENRRRSGSWSGWQVIESAPSLRGYPAAILAPSGEITVAVRGTDDQVHLVRRSPAGTWGDSFVLEGLRIDTMPSLFVNPDGRVEVFVRGADHAAWHAAERSAGGEWGQWWSLGGSLRTMVTVTASDDGAPHIFAIGDAAGHVFHRERTAPDTWSSWRYLELRGNTPVSPLTMPDGRIGVFVRNERGQLVQQFQEADGDWREARVVGGSLTGNVVALFDGRGRVNVIARGRDGAIVRVVRSEGGRWGAFARLGGRASMGPSAVRTSNGIEVFVTGGNHAMYHATQSRTARRGWSGWHAHGGRLGWM